ncbi:Agamous-like MADS-box protein AGL80 [Vitis vinifera]|uniref:Agamous-like MADS-box protein AGL80 n=1 Tax=Vitis vinifera TaxID=29760 RepID=A0A438F8E4_VITVI|nr:Agamous-like MADS-box protein AGL80 [Vitis vinifera]
MARKKFKLQWIMNDTARRTTYKKRGTGLMKKVKELSILCGVEACTIVYSPYDPQPEVWPSPMEAVRVVGEFKSRTENDQTKKGLKQENYTRQRVAKAKDQLVKQQKKNRRMEMENLIRPQDGVLPSSVTPTRRCCCSSCSSVAQKTLALESLENQMLMDIAPRPPDSLVTVAYPGVQDMMHPAPYGHYEDPSFWGPPFFA